jgi:tRNA C32,U32 (ribose-2'-O)-methylase TrmJ
MEQIIMEILKPIALALSTALGTTLAGFAITALKHFTLAQKALRLVHESDAKGGWAHDAAMAAKDVFESPEITEKLNSAMTKLVGMVNTAPGINITTDEAENLARAAYQDFKSTFATEYTATLGTVEDAIAATTTTDSPIITTPTEGVTDAPVSVTPVTTDTPTA